MFYLELYYNAFLLLSIQYYLQTRLIILCLGANNGIYLFYMEQY